MNKIIIHTSKTKNGSMKKSDKNYEHNMNIFLKDKKLNKNNLVTMSQTHSSNVKIVTEKEKGKRVTNCDGLVTKDKNVILAAVTADCIPLMVYDEKNGIVGVAHAGYKGILNGIIESIVRKLKEAGAIDENVKVVIGPSIASCCYSINRQRARKFTDKFEKAQKALEEKSGNIYISLQKIVESELLRLGVKKEHIKDTNKCTKCSADYFSYRRDFEKTGLFTSIITAI